MGVYLNPGKDLFEKAFNSEIFVDKTEMIRDLNAVVQTLQKDVCITRPHKFGKTMTADMICAYYDKEADSRGLFEQCLISSTEPVEIRDRKVEWDAYLGKFDVIRLNMPDFINEDRNVKDGLKLISEKLFHELNAAYPDTDFYDITDPIQVVEDVYVEYNRQVVVVIDDWDAVFFARKEDMDGQVQYLKFLRGLLKDNAHVALAYMTGILPIKKLGNHSSLNNFDECTMLFPVKFAEYTGFTEAEVQKLCNQYGRDFTEVKDWYEGYELCGIVPLHMRLNGKAAEPPEYRIYNPLSILEVMKTGHIENYWMKSESSGMLADYLSMDMDGLKDAVACLINGGRLRIETDTFQNDLITFRYRDDVLTLLVHLGYLGYDMNNSEVFIPNKEILSELRSVAHEVLYDKQSMIAQVP